MKQILVGLQTSYKTTNSRDLLKHREDWICAGLSSLSKIETFIEKSDCCYFDNTVNDEEELPDSIRSVIPKSCKRIYTTEANQYGSINKGAGVIEMMRHIKDTIMNYDWYVHHEPRTVIQNSGMFDSFLSEPSNLFKVGSPGNPHEKSFWTGTFFIATEILIDYLEDVDLDNMCNENISLEFDIRDFIESSGVAYRSFDPVGIIWNDIGAGVNRSV